MNLKIMKKSLVLISIFSFIWGQLPSGELNDPNPSASEVIRVSQTSEGSTESAEIRLNQTSERSPSASEVIRVSQTSEGSTESAEIRLNQTSERSPSASEVIRVNQISEGN